MPFDVKIASCLHLPKAALLGQGCVSSGEAKNTYGTGEKQIPSSSKNNGCITLLIKQNLLKLDSDLNKKRLLCRLFHVIQHWEGGGHLNAWAPDHCCLSGDKKQYHSVVIVLFLAPSVL